MARINDLKRSKNPERKKYQLEREIIRRKNNKDKKKAHTKVRNYLRYNRDKYKFNCCIC